MEVHKIREINLRVLIKDSGESVDGFCKLTNTSPSYISQVFSTKSEKKIGDRFARKIEIACKKPTGWMDKTDFDGDDAMFIESPADRWAIPQAWIKSQQLNPDSLEMITIKSDSMSPELNDGDSVVLDKSDVVIEDGQLYALTTPTSAIVRRLLLRADGKIIIKADNTAHAELIVDAVDNIKGRVVLMIRNYS
jgi:SOS-response transcriptional repressor LexA